MTLRDTLWFRSTAALLAVSMIILGAPSAVRAQVVVPGIDPIDRPSSAATVPMSVAVPSDTEVVQAERPVINPSPVSTLPLEEPLDPDKYICGRGDVFELNFWGRQNFKLRVTVDMEGRTFISKVGYVDIVGKSIHHGRGIIMTEDMRFIPLLPLDYLLFEACTLNWT